MSVVAFERKPVTGVWSESELNTIVAALHAALAPAPAANGKPARRKTAMLSFICWARCRIRPASYACHESGGTISSKTDRAGCCSSIETSISSYCMPGPRSSHVVAYGALDHVVVCGSECVSRKARADACRDRGTAGSAGTAACGFRLIANSIQSSDLIFSVDRHANLKVSMTSKSSATSRASKTSRKAAMSKEAAAGKAAAAKSKTGKLPEWNLADLYSGIDAPEVARDLQKMDADCVAFETDYKGKLAERAAREDGGNGSPRRSGATRRSTISPAGSAPMPASFMPATASIPRSPNSMATFPSG